MKRLPTILAVLSFGVIGVSSGWAADPSMGPPPVLQIDREEVKPGKGAAHEKIEAGWPAAFKKANNPTHYIGMTSFSGPSEAWFLIPWDSFAAAEKQQKADSENAALTAETDRLSATDGELLTRWSVLWASYRADLSYRPDFDVAKMRYFAVTTFRVNPGHDADFAAARKLVIDAHEKAKVDEHWAMYQASSGAPGGTYLLFLPLRSLAEVDANGPWHGKPMQDALGEENQKKLRDLLGAALRSSETVHFTFNPKMSYLSKEVAGRDPEFWTPKPKPAAAPAKKAEAKKPEAKK